MRSFPAALRVSWMAAAMSISLPCGRAQLAAEKEKEEPIVLSPFTVQAESSKGAAEPEPTLLFGEANGFRMPELQARGAAASVAGERLRIDGAATAVGGDRRGVMFPLRREPADLSRHRYIEFELTNAGEKPVVFTFWALSGNGWGGVSTFSTTGSARGRETLGPGAHATFRVDLHARYSGRDVYTKAIDPAAVRWLEILFEDDRNPVAVELGPIRATGRGPDAPHDTSGRVWVPDVVEGAPAPGRRVYQKLPGWENTEVRHVLTLPRDWTPGGAFPVIIEYTGNVFYHKYCHSTGRTDQGNLAYGLARGERFICLNLPFISEEGKREQVDGWGDIEKGVDYCLAALDFVQENYGADPRAVFFTGFSRGSYAANYLALRHERIARVWAGFLTLRNPGVEWPSAEVRGWRGVDVGWNERAARMSPRLWFHQPDELGAEVHADVEFLEDRPSTVATRRWLHEVLAAATKENK